MCVTVHYSCTARLVRVWYNPAQLCHHIAGGNGRQRSSFSTMSWVTTFILVCIIHARYHSFHPFLPSIRAPVTSLSRCQHIQHIHRTRNTRARKRLALNDCQSHISVHHKRRQLILNALAHHRTGRFKEPSMLREQIATTRLGIIRVCARQALSSTRRTPPRERPLVRQTVLYGGTRQIEIRIARVPYHLASSV